MRVATGQIARGGTAGVRNRSRIPIALLALLLAPVALQRGGYFPESWGIPTAAAGFVVALTALLGDRQRLRPAERVPIAALASLAGLALASAAWASGGLGSALPVAQLLVLDVAVLMAVLMLFARATELLATIWACLTAICFVSLGTRLFPAAAMTEAAGGNRLSAPLGYWNSLGLWSVMGLILGIALAARGRSVLLRCAAGASTVPCTATLYFTYSRGAWAALALGLVAALAIDPRRLGFAAWTLLVTPCSVIAVLVASRMHGLTAASPELVEARHDGHKLAITLVLLGAVASVVTAWGAYFERRSRVPRAVRTGFAACLIAVCALGATAVVVRFGTPWSIASELASKIESPPRAPGEDLNSRLLDISSNGRVDLWRVAWQDVTQHPLLGSGAGSYASRWFEFRRDRFDATNAHELYLETAAELGIIGLILLATALGAPLIAAWRGRRHPLAGGAVAAYVAFLGHAAVDWDWQLAAVSLAALATGAALLIMARAARSTPARIRDRTLGIFAGVGIAVFALWSLQGANPLGESRDAIADGQWVTAESKALQAIKHDGDSSSLAWQYLGEAQLALRKPNAARKSLLIAVKRDPQSWEAWYDLALITDGKQRRTAVREALALNPLGAETQGLTRDEAHT